MATIYAVGANGTVLKSTDNGNNWAIKPAPSANELRAVWAITETEVFAAPRNANEIYRTIDGGDNWTTINLPNPGFSSPIPARLKFFGSNGVLAVRNGSNAAFYTSGDGGLTWQLQPNTITFLDVVFISETTWKISNNSGEIWVTTTAANTPFTLVLDAGASAQKIDSFNNTEFVAFAGGAARRVVGNVGDVIQTIPGQSGTPEAFQMSYIRINPFEVSAGQNFVYVGSGTKIATRNVLSGGTWSDRSSFFNALNQINAVHFITAFNAVFVGVSGEIVITDTGLLGNDANSIRITPVSGNTLYDVHGTETPCLATVDSVTTTDANQGQNNGVAVINDSNVVTPEYRLINQTAGGITPWQPSNTFSNLPPGNYIGQVREVGTDCFAGLQFTIASVQDLAGNLTPTDVSAPGATDGQIITNITSGSGSYSYSWSNGEVTKDLFNLPVGFYVLTVTDNVTGQQLILDAAINEPIPDTPPPPYFEVPQINSLQFVEEITPGCDTFQDHDRQLFCKQRFPYFTQKNYFQLVAQCDSHTIQFRSNLPNHEITILDYKTNTQAALIVPELKLSYTGQSETIGVNIANNGGGTSRVYFAGGGSFPFEVTAGDSFEVINNADGFNGTYIVQSVENDALTASDYLVINANYGIGSPSSQADAVFTVNVLDFDIWEFVIDWALIPQGNYYVKIRAFDDGTNERIGISEPINLKSNHENAVLIEFTNNDNAFDIDYQTLIVHRLRVESVLFKRLPASTRSTLRNTDGSLRNLSAKPRRVFLLEFFQLPPYLHEKLAVAFDHDFIKVNGIEYVTEDGYQEPGYITRYPLSNSQITIEQKDWFKTYNGDDLGGVDDEQGFIIANEGFIKR